MKSEHFKKLTEEGIILWTELRDFRKRGFAFRRQAKIGPFTVDFLCRKARLIIEADGDHHGYDDVQWDHDQYRDAWLKTQGYDVLRFWNADIRNDLYAIIAQIEASLITHKT